MNPNTEGISPIKPESIAQAPQPRIEVPTISPTAQLGAEADNILKAEGPGKAIDTVAGMPMGRAEIGFSTGAPLETNATSSSSSEDRPIGFSTPLRAEAGDTSGGADKSADAKKAPEAGKAEPAAEPKAAGEPSTGESKKETTTDSAKSTGTASETGSPFVSDSKEPPTLAEQIDTTSTYLDDLKAQREKLANTPIEDVTFEGSHQVPLKDEEAKAYKEQQLREMDEEITQTEQSIKEMKDKLDPDRENKLKDKIRNKTATAEDIEEHNELMRKGKEATPEEKIDKEFEELAEKIANKGATPEEMARYEELKAKDVQKELSTADQAWKDKAAKGENPADELVEFLTKFNEKMGYDPLTDREVKDLKGFLKDVYESGVSLPQVESSRIREKFVELGKMEAQEVALKELIRSMKKSEGKMKTETHVAEDAYLSESDPQEKMRKLAVWRQKALQLEGYQMAINDQAARGREINIKRRIAAGYIHRKLGTRGLGGNIAFGLGTLGYEISDTFQDITIDNFRDTFA